MATGGQNREGSFNEGSGEAQAAEATTPEREAAQGNAADIAPVEPNPDLVSQKLRAILQDEQKTRELIQETGKTREELESFVRKFERPSDLGPAREAMEIDPAEEAPRTFDADRRLEGALPSATVSSRSDRGPNSAPEDRAGGNVEGIRTAVPPGFSDRFRAFQEAIAGSGSTPQP